MSYTYNFGNTPPPSSSGSIPIDVSGCWPNLRDESQKNAEEILSVIDKYPHATDQLAKDFRAIMDEAKQAGLCPFVDGVGPIIDKAKAVLAKARSIKANPPAPPAPPPPPPGSPAPGGAGVVASSTMAPMAQGAPPIPAAPDFFDPGPPLDLQAQPELPIGLMVGGALALVALGTAIYLLV